MNGDPTPAPTPMPAPEGSHPPLDPESRTGEGERPSSWRRLGWVVLMVIFVAIQAAPAGLRALGHWLIVDEEPEAADAIFVHAGQAPIPAMEAAALFGRGLAPEIWIPQLRPGPEDEALLQLGLSRPSEHALERQALLRLGIPSSAIRLLEEPVASPAEEIRLVIDEMQRRGLDRVLLVSAKHKTRRIGLLWARLAPDGLSAQTRGAAGDTFDPDGWWRSPTSGAAAVHELVAILYARFGGSVEG